jgi:uncharacterized surface protein with fasciclin (FAS1) repeats
MVVASCQDSDFDKYYERPSWMEAPAWNVLEQRGDCKTYLQLVGKTLYSKQISGSGSYTFFVPTDEAFEAFFADNPYGYKSVDDIPADMASEIVSFTMLYNAYPCDSLGNTLDGYNTWTRGAAYKHQTPSYEVLTRDYMNGDSIWVYNNKKGTIASPVNNYRYLPVFTKTYWKENALSENDYNAFYPTSDGSVWSDYGNVLGAQIKEVSSGSGDLYCENGVIHLMDKVVLPLKNLDRMIIDYGNESQSSLPSNVKGGAWSTLKKMLYHKTGDGNYQFLSYSEDANWTHYFEKMYPNRDLSSLKLRDYSGTLPFNLNDEGYSGSVEGDNAYNSGATLFVPDEQAMSDYLNNRIFAYLDESEKGDIDVAFNSLSEEVLPKVWNSLFANGIVWPSHYESAQNLIGSNEFINGGRSGNNFSSVVEQSAMASNGAVHVINFFPKTAAFEGVGSRFLLDPSFSLMEQVYASTYRTSIYSTMLLSPLSNYNQVDLTVILASDKMLKSRYGLYYDAVAAAFKNRGDADVSSYVNAMARMSYIERDTTDRLDLTVDPLEGAYGGWAYTTTYLGELIRYKTIGSMVSGKPAIAIQSNYNLNIGGASEYNTTPDPSDDNRYSVMPQTESPDWINSVVAIEDPTYDGYNNGKVYTLLDENLAALGYLSSETTYTPVQYLEWYLCCDSAQVSPKHSLFKTLWDLAKEATTAPTMGSGFWTVLVPTDEALQYAVDKGYFLDPEKMAKLQKLHNNDATNYPENYADTAANLVNVYLLSGDIYPDDGLSTLYTSGAWSAPSALVDISSGWPVSTSYKPMTDVWEDFMSGTTKLSMRLNKVGDTHKLRFLGRDYESGSYVAAKAINASQLDGTRFDNMVVRELGQSNVMAERAVIHSLNGFVLYQIQSKE